MAQALSGDEFQRMQAQLLELRTQNYQLADELRKQSAEVNSLRLRCTNVEKDLAKAQKAVTKSKKAQEVDALLSENEMLQGKLHSQEEDFRLQNTTLMQELSKLCSQIEELEGENKRLSGAPLEAGTTPAAQPQSQPQPGELLRLQAENTALQRNLAALQQRFELEVQAPSQDTEQDGGGDEGPVASPGEDEGPPGDEATDGAEKEPQEASRTSPEKLEQLQSKCTKLEQKLKEFNEMGLRCEVEREEKRLLKEQLQALETSKQSELTKLQEEATKVSEKLKKKQESFLHLQGEKEALYNDSRTKITELQQKKEEDLKSLSARNQRLQTEAQITNQNLSELKEQVQKMEIEHGSMVQALREQVVCQNVEYQEQMDTMLSENDDLRTGLAALEQIQTAKTQEMNQLREQMALQSLDLRQRQGELDQLAAQRDDLLTQLQGISEAKELLMEQTQLLEKEVERLREELEESAKLADNRKALLDGLAIERQREAGLHQDALSSLRLKHDRDTLAVRARYERELRDLHDGKARSEEGLREQLREEKSRSRDLEALQVKMQGLQEDLESARGDKECIHDQLHHLQELMERTEREHQQSTQELQQEHAMELQAREGETQTVREELSRVESERDGHGETIARLQQEVKDTVDGQRILEKKGSSALKDLKRQLQLERRRADKLQERLQDFLTNTRTRSGLEDFVLGDIGSPGRTQTGDSSSISSFSLRDTVKDSTASKSNTGSPQFHRPVDLTDDEISDLFQRLAEVQQEKWMLEEKVKHLEVSCSSMADDLCRKSSIIETYVMDSRIDVSAGQSGAERERTGGFGSVLRDLVKPGDENVREMNKKLQNMLEEQLTKNMHLQKDLELLSQELVRLSKAEGIVKTPKLS